MTREETLRSYRNYAPAYDLIFGQVFQDGRKLAAELANSRRCQDILEVGVGTGLSMPLLRKDVRLTGIDISEEMLVQARERAIKLGHGQDWQVELGDVQDMTFPDASFDAVLALYVASTVQDVRAFGREIARVCKPGGEIIIVNHFSSRHPVMGAFERFLGHYAGRLGFQSDFPLDRFIEESGLKPFEVVPTGFLGYWKLLRIINR
ncbi:MAG TPA: class I SAM-dependent methyltransferase [Stellaceae bacterium]|nr:class I SAM-dependent methyltransferase [Stellaceae bacterium]